MLPARRHRRQLAGGGNLAAQLKQRNYPEAAIALILGGTPLEI